MAALGSSSNQVTQPYTPQLPYQSAGWGEAARLYDRGALVPGAYDKIIERAQAGSPQVEFARQTLNELFSNSGVPGASANLRSVANGSYIGKNPYIGKLYDQAAGSVRSQVNSQFAGAGRYGSGAHQGVLGEQLSRLANQMYGDDYTRERQYQLQAAVAETDADQRAAQSINTKRLQAVALAPGLADADYRDLQQMAAAQQAQIQAPWDNLMRYMGLLAGGPSGSIRTTTRPEDQLGGTQKNLNSISGLFGLFQ